MGGGSFLWMISNPVAPMATKSEINIRAIAHSASTVVFIVAFAVGLGLFAAATFKKSDKAKVAPLLLLLGLGLLVSYFSSGHGGADPMIDFVIRTLHVSRPRAETIVVIVRKCIHFTFYFTVATTGYLAASSNRGNRAAAVRTGFFSALTLSAYDEMRQHSMPNRQGSAWDVLLDMVGASTAMLLISRKLSQKKTAKKA